MRRDEILRHVGSMQQVACVRRLTFGDGRARGLEAVEVKNGPLRYTVMADKCLDICELSYKGLNISFLSKPGLNGRNPFDTHGAEAQRSIMGGLFFTCGLENICAPYTGGDGKEYPMHGRLRTTPAEHLSADAAWQGEDYVLTVSGEMREAELFGENLVLRRTITSRYGESEIRLVDEVCNEGFRAEPMMLMYHCNMGFPFLREGTRLILPTEQVTPRDQASAGHREGWAVMDAPRDNEPEYVFLHQLRADGDGSTFAAVVDDESEIAFELCFNRRQLPYFMEWKSTASGDYVIGLEPSNSAVYGRGYHEERGDLHLLPAQSGERVELIFRVHEGAEAIEELEKRCRNLLG